MYRQMCEGRWEVYDVSEIGRQMQNIYMQYLVHGRAIPPANKIKPELRALHQQCTTRNKWHTNVLPHHANYKLLV